MNAAVCGQHGESRCLFLGVVWDQGSKYGWEALAWTLTTDWRQAAEGVSLGLPQYLSMLHAFVVKLVLPFQNGHFFQHFICITSLQVMKKDRKLILLWKEVVQPLTMVFEALLHDSVLLLLRAMTPWRIGCQSLSTQFCFLESSLLLPPFKTHLTWAPASIFCLYFQSTLSITWRMFWEPKSDHVTRC